VAAGTRPRTTFSSLRNERARPPSSTASRAWFATTRRAGPFYRGALSRLGEPGARLRRGHLVRPRGQRKTVFLTPGEPGSPVHIAFSARAIHGCLQSDGPR